MSVLEKRSRGSSPASLENPSSVARKPQRVLACVLCQQRKLKCDRKFPCANCVRSHAQCIPAATLGPRQRRRRFPERELLERLRQYESLLQQNNIKFEPLHRDDSIAEKHDKAVGDASRSYGSPDNESIGTAMSVDHASPFSASVKSERLHEAKNIWHAMNQTAPNRLDDSSDSSRDNLDDATVKKAWHEMYQSDEHLLFGSQDKNINIHSLHPEQAQIFRLWQIFIDNVNPLLRVIHVPTLQGRIIDAACNMANIDPNLEALMFGIYCVSTLSLTEDECTKVFGSSKEPLLTKYRVGCQQCLVKCGFLRSNDLDCLVALLLYLIAVRPDIDPLSLSSMLGLAVRIAQRMGIHSESSYDKCPVFEAEMRRRVWWSLILFDARICEMAASRTTMLTPTWDCRTPLSVNDFDLQPEMTNPPIVTEQATEALFTVVRSEMGDFVRNSSFHLEFVNPSLKAIARDVHRGQSPDGSGEATILEEMVEEKFLKSCNPENPLHYMTIWTARGYLAKCRLIEHFSRFPTISAQPTIKQRDTIVPHALRVLECDTKLLSSPLAKGYIWFIHFQFPLPAYIYILQDLKRRPLTDHAEQSWEAMSDNYEARLSISSLDENPLFKSFIKMILQAWAAREAASRQSQTPLLIPRIVSTFKQILMRMRQGVDNTNVETPNYAVDTSREFSTSIPGDTNLLHGVGTHAFERPDFISHDSMPELNFSDWNWSPLDWNSMYNYSW